MLNGSPAWGWRVGPLFATQVALLGLFDLGRQPGAAILVLFLAFAAFFYAVVACEQAATPVSLRSTLLVAALLRLVLIPLPPTLSDDTLRYIWDGRVVSAGFDPYQLAPEAAELTALRDASWEKMPHHQVPTVYPPLALMLFALASQLPWPLISIKILLSLIDLLGCALLYRLAQKLELPPTRVLFYAWNPLLLLETAGMGHVDSLMATLSIAAVLLLAQGRPARAGAAAAAAVAAKLLPLLALPLWLRRSRPRWIFAAATAALLTAFFLPLALLSGLPRGLWIYGKSWEWNGPLFEPLWRLIDVAELAPRIKSLLDQLKLWSETPGWHHGLNQIYPLVYPQLLAKAVLGSALLAFLAYLCWRPPAPAIAIGRAFGAFLLASATVYPWYLIGILPWAALCRRRSWLLAAALQPLSYLPQKLPGLTLFPFFSLLIWLPVGLLLWREKPWSIA